MAEPRASRTIGETLRASSAVHVAGAIAALVIAIVLLLDLRLSAIRHQTLTRRTRDEATVPSPGALRILSLGHREWAADLLWSAALLYFGETVSTRAQQRFLQSYAETLEAVDPNFRRAYLWGATISIYNTRTIRRESVEAAIGHLERGLRAFPDDGEMLYQLGFDYYFELPRFADDQAERTEWKRRGAEYLRRAAGLGYGPPWMALAAAEALRDVGLTDRAVEQLRDMYLRTEDTAVRARIRAQIEELSGRRAETDPLLEAVREMQHERLSSFPYMAPLLYLFVGPPVPGVAHYVPIEQTPLGAEMHREELLQARSDAATSSDAAGD
jgi:hypothetical protein